MLLCIRCKEWLLLVYDLKFHCLLNSCLNPLPHQTWHSERVITAVNDHTFTGQSLDKSIHRTTVSGISVTVEWLSFHVKLITSFRSMLYRCFNGRKYTDTRERWAAIYVRSLGGILLSDHLQEYYCQITWMDIYVRSHAGIFMLDHLEEYYCQITWRNIYVRSHAGIFMLDHWMMFILVSDCWTVSIHLLFRPWCVNS